MFVLALTPPLAALWRARARAGRDPHPVAKTALGGALLAASWLLLALACAGSGGTGGAGGPGPGSAGAPAAPPQKTPASAVVLQQLVLTAAELLVSPVGLQFVAAEAPPELGSLVMGAWFLSSFLGSYAGGALGARYPDVPPATFWTLCAAVAAAAAAATAAARGALLDALAQPADDD